MKSKLILLLAISLSCTSRNDLVEENKELMLLTRHLTQQNEELKEEANRQSELAKHAAAEARRAQADAMAHAQQAAEKVEELEKQLKNCK